MIPAIARNGFRCASTTLATHHLPKMNVSSRLASMPYAPAKLASRVGLNFSTPHVQSAATRRFSSEKPKQPAYALMQYPDRIAIKDYLETHPMMQAAQFPDQRVMRELIEAFADKTTSYDGIRMRVTMALHNAHLEPYKFPDFVHLYLVNTFTEVMTDCLKPPKKP